MTHEHLPAGYLMTENDTTGACEIWLDWMSAVDDAPGTPLGFLVEQGEEGDQVLIGVVEQHQEQNKGARFVPQTPLRVLKKLDPQAKDFLLSSPHVVVVLCGPSGVLAHVPARLVN